MLLASQVISVAFYNEHGKSEKFCSEALISDWGSFMCCKSRTWIPLLYFPSEGSHTQDFYALKNPLTPAGFEPTNLRSSGESDNHGTTGVDVISHNFVVCTMADPYCCCEVVYRLGAVDMHKLCNLFNFAFSLNHFWPTSMHIIFQTVSPLRKMLVPCNHNTATQCVTTINLLHHLKRFGSTVLPNFWQNLMFVSCSICNIFEFQHTHSNHHHSNAGST